MLTVSQRKEIKYCERRIKHLQEQESFKLKAVTRDEIEMLKEIYRDMIDHIISRS